jgi:hypothetical protein
MYLIFSNASCFLTSQFDNLTLSNLICLDCSNDTSYVRFSKSSQTSVLKFNTLKLGFQ